MNNFPISSKGIGDALLRSAAALSSANNTLDESIALITAANAVAQDPEKVGTSLKTVSMFLRASKNEALAAGESIEGMANSVSELQKDILKLTGGKVDIMADANTYKSTFQILREIAGVWDTLSDVNQANILEKIAGKRQANIVSGLLKNFELAEETLTTSLNSSGSALKENEKVLESIGGRMSVLKSTFEEFSSSVLNSGLVKIVISGLTIFLEGVNRVNEATGGLVQGIVSLTLVVGALVATFSAFKALKIGAHFANLKAAISLIPEAIMGLSPAMIGLAAVVGIVAVAGLAMYSALNKTKREMQEFAKEVNTLQGELDRLNDQVDKNNDRIEKLQELRAKGSLSIIDQKELSGLENENKLLARQISYQEKLIAVKKAELNEAAHNRLGEVSGEYSAFGFRKNYASHRDELQDLEETRQKALDQLENDPSNQQLHSWLDNIDLQIGKVREKIIEDEREILEIAQNLDPETEQGQKDLEAIDVLLGKIKVSLDGINGYKNIWKDFWGNKNSDYQKLQKAAAEAKKNKDYSTFADAAESNEAFKKFRDIMIQIDPAMENFTPEKWASSFIDFADAVEDSTVPLSSLTETLDGLENKLQLIKTLQTQLRDVGSISSKTLSEVVKFFPSLSDSVRDYISGVMTGQQLFNSVQSEYENDLKNYKDTFTRKRLEATDFYNDLSEAQRKSVMDLYDAYQKDKQNFAAVEKAKLTIQQSVLAQLAKNYHQYVGITKQELEAEKKRLGEQLSKPYNNDGITRSILGQQLSDVTNALNEIDSREKELEEIFNADPPDPYAPKDKKDTHKEAADRELAALKHRLEMDQITKREYYVELRTIQNKYYTDTAAHRKKYYKEIQSIDEEIFKGERDLLQDSIKIKETMVSEAMAAGNYEAARRISEEILAEIQNNVKNAIDYANKYGIGENAEYVQELKSQAKKASQDILDLVTKTFDDFKQYADDFDLWGDLDFTKLEFLKKHLKELEKMYKSGIIGWQQYVDEYNRISKDLYDTQKESIETIIDMTMEMIEQEAEEKTDALEKQIDDYKKIVELKKEMLQDTDKEKDHETRVAEIVEEIAKLQSKISQLSLDDSREATAQRAELEEQLADKQKELNDLQQDYTLDTTVETLDKSFDAFEKEKQDETKAIEKEIDTWVKKYNKAIELIDGDMDGLYKDLDAWMKEHRDSIDGPDSLKTSWENLIQLKKEYASIGSGGIEDIYNGLGGEHGINPNPSSVPGAQAILDQMKSNSLYALTHKGSGLNAENKRLRDEFEKLTGYRLEQGSDMVWKDQNGNAIYDLTGPIAEGQNPYSPGSASYGDENSDAVRWAQYQLAHGAGFSQPVDGNFWSTTKANIERFQAQAGLSVTGKLDAETRRRLNAYHTGGIVDGRGSVNDRESMALLEKGEWVLDERRQNAVKALLKHLSGTIDTQAISGFFRNALKTADKSGGDTFAPHLEVHIEHNGQLDDSDAQRYGNIIGDTALEKLRTAFKKRGM